MDYLESRDKKEALQAFIDAFQIFKNIKDRYLLLYVMDTAYAFLNRMGIGAESKDNDEALYNLWKSIMPFYKPFLDPRKDVMLKAEALLTKINILRRDSAMSAAKKSYKDIDDTGLKKMFRNLLTKLDRRKVAYDQDFVDSLGLISIKLALAVRQNNINIKFLKSIRVYSLLFQLTNNEGIKNELFKDYLTDLRREIYLICIKLKKEIESSGHNMVFSREKIEERVMSISDEIYSEEKQEVRRITQENRDRLREQNEQFDRELFHMSQVRKEEKLSSSPLPVVTVAVSPAHPGTQQPQKREERIQVPTKILDELLQAWEIKGSEIRIMASKLGVLDAVIERLSVRTMLPIEVVEPRFVEFARAQGLSKEEFFNKLSSTDNGNGKAPSPALESPGQLPVQRETILPILVYKDPKYVYSEWERSKDEIIAELNKAFLPENIETTKESFMYKWVPGIFRFKIYAEGSWYSIYARYYEEDNKLLVFGFHTQSVFHDPENGQTIHGLNPTFARFLSVFKKSKNIIPLLRM